MSPAQETLYWRRWSAVCHANDWRWVRGRLAPEAVTDGSGHHTAVWQIAEARALQEHRPVAADDLRHACHIYAFKRDMSMKAMPNTAFSRLLCLWGDGKNKCGLLIEPECIESRMHWEDSTLSSADGVHAALKRLPEETVRHVATDKFGGRNWEWLNPDQKLQLLMTLNGWQRSKKVSSCRTQGSRKPVRGTDVGSASRELDPENVPF